MTCLMKCKILQSYFRNPSGSLSVVSIFIHILERPSTPDLEILQSMYCVSSANMATFVNIAEGGSILGAGMP